MNDKIIDKPFDKDILKKASKIAENYIIKIEPNKDLGFVGHGMKFPTVFGDGKTKEECIKNVREAITITIAYMLEENIQIPEIGQENEKI